MNRQSKNGPSGSKMLSQQDKEMGFQLLLSPKATVNVLSPTVPHESTHLYPKLAGPNWTCYITGSMIRLGRRPEHTSTSNKYTNNKITVDVDFCGNKQISRRHADIKFNAKKKYWELYVHGRIGVKVNHHLISKTRHPVPLTAMAYLDIGGNGFVFVLPDHTDGVPGNGDTQQTATDTTLTSEKAPPPPPPPPVDSQPDTVLENERNDQLVTLIVDVLKSLGKQSCAFTTQQIFKATIQMCRKKSLDYNEYTMDAVLRALVFDSQFKVAKECMDMTAEQSDKVQWCWERPPSPPTTTVASFDTSNSEAWSDIHYDFMDGDDHPIEETHEDLSTTTGTPTPMDSGAWLPSSIAETTVPTTTDIIPSSSSSTTAQPAVSTMTTNITSPVLSSGYPSAENETHFSAMTTAPLSQTTASTTVPSIISSSVNRSLGERTLSAFSFSSILDDGPFSPSYEADPAEAPQPSDRTPWASLEHYHASAFPDQHAAIPGYSRGLSLYNMYSSILAATRQQPDTTIDEPLSFDTPCTLFPTTPDDNDIELDLACSNRKRKQDSISDHEDRTLWTSFRTTVFKSRA